MKIFKRYPLPSTEILLMAFLYGKLNYFFKAKVNVWYGKYGGVLLVVKNERV